MIMQPVRNRTSFGRIFAAIKRALTPSPSPRRKREPKTLTETVLIQGNKKLQDSGFNVPLPGERNVG
jgi:hypothetical protein